MKSYTYTPLLTDLYQFTMSYGYWSLGMHEQEAVFHLLFRKNPFNHPFALCCGMESVIDYLANWHFTREQLDYLSELKNPKQQPLFSSAFINYLQHLKFTCDIDAIPEGTIVFPHTPLLRIQGPLLQCQLLESPLLNIINFQTLIATKASRVRSAAGNDTVIEFGMRRAQGPDGAISASRAAYIGGCDATSNTLAGMLFDIPVRGTHAHSWVSAFDSELSAFNAYQSVMPENCVLLVDTYDTIRGVNHAIEIGKKLRAQGSDLLGIRLDSGDLAALSIAARKLLDEAGFQQTEILASNSLDEYVITSLKQQGAKISAWGVGTSLVTASDQSALDGVYKLAALKDKQGHWQYKLKLSEQEIKISNPGRHQVRRFFYNEQYFTDVIYDLDLGISDAPEIILLTEGLKSQHLDNFDAYVDLLEPVMREGQLVRPRQSTENIRTNAQQAIAAFHQTAENTDYPVGLEKQIYDVKLQLMQQFRK